MITIESMRMPKTERLTFRTWTEQDWPLALELWGDDDVMTYLGGVTEDKVRTRFNNEMAYQRDHGIQYWPMFDDGKFVGCCGLKPWLFSEHGKHELGFHLVKEAWGKGYAPEAARGVIEWARQQKIATIMAGHHPENKGARKILESLGFSYIETVFYPITGLMHPTYKLGLTV